MDHFTSMCCSSTLNTQVLFYDGHDIHFDDRSLNILWSHYIQSLIIKSGESMHEQPNDNGPKLKPKNLYGNERMNWMGKHGTIKFTPYHINYALVETWEALKPSSTTITQKYSKKTHLLPL